MLCVHMRHSGRWQCTWHSHSNNI